jgi:hypothetical protein
MVGAAPTNETVTTVIATPNPPPTGGDVVAAGTIGGVDWAVSVALPAEGGMSINGGVIGGQTFVEASLGGPIDSGSPSVWPLSSDAVLLVGGVSAAVDTISVLDPNGNTITTAMPIEDVPPARIYVIPLLHDDLGGSLEVTGGDGTMRYPLPAPRRDTPPSDTTSSDPYASLTTTSPAPPSTTEQPMPPTTGAVTAGRP